MKIETYNLTAKNGRHIRRASMVTLPSGRVVKFLEKHTRREIIRFVADFMVTSIDGTEYMISGKSFASHPGS